MLISEVLKIRDFSKLLKLLFATPQQLLWGRDPPVGNHWSIALRGIKCVFLFEGGEFPAKAKFYRLICPK